MKTLKSTMYLALAAAGLAVGLTACDALNVKPDLSYDGGKVTFTLPVITEAGTLQRDTTIETTVVKKFISDAGYNIDDFSDVKVTSANLAITTDNTTFDILDAADVYAAATQKATPSTANLMVSVKPEKKGLKTVSMNPNSELNLIELFKGDKIYVRALVKSNAKTDAPTDMLLSYSLKISPK